MMAIATLLDQAGVALDAARQQQEERQREVEDDQRDADGHPAALQPVRGTTRSLPAGCPTR